MKITNLIFHVPCSNDYTPLFKSVFDNFPHSTSSYTTVWCNVAAFMLKGSRGHNQLYHDI